MLATPRDIAPTGWSAKSPLHIVTRGRSEFRILRRPVISASSPKSAKHATVIEIVDWASGMKPYPKYATTVIGAHSVPDWYEALDRLVSFGQLSMAAMTDAQYRASQAAILDQELAGIDVITGGEMHRRTHNRHSPPNAMLNYFWQRIPAFQGSTRPKPITPYDPNVFHPAATCHGRIDDNIDLGLVDEFKTVSALTQQAGQDHDDRAAHAGQGRL